MKSLFILAVLTLFSVPQAFAGFQITAEGAGAFNTSSYGFVSSPNLMLGVQLTTDVGYPIQVGLAYEHNDLNYTDGDVGGDLRFYGVVARLRTVSPAYFDLQAGFNQRDSIGISFSWGVGAGVAIPVISSIEFAPRIGYRSVPDGGIERSMVDIGALMIFKFY